MDKASKAEEYFLQGYACSQSVLMAYAYELGIDMETAKKISSAFGAGMGRLRKTCGALTGAFMVIGMKYGNTDPKDMKTKLGAYDIVRELHNQFELKHGTSDCKDLLIKYADTKSVEARDHHKIICCSLVRDAANFLESILENKESK